MWEPQDPNSLVHATSTTGDVPNGISAGMEAIGSLLNESNDQDDEIMQFQGVPGTYSTPKPADGFFQSPQPAYAHSGSSNSTLTEIGVNYNYNGNGFMGTSQPYQLPPVPTHHSTEQQESMDLSTATLTHSTSEAQANPFSHPPQEQHQQMPAVSPPTEPPPRPSGASVQPYKCDHCEKRFRNMAQLNMHTRKHHPEFVPPESEPESDSESEEDNTETGNKPDTETDNVDAKTKTDAAETETNTNANAADTETPEVRDDDAVEAEAKAKADAENSAQVEPEPEANTTDSSEPIQDQSQEQLQSEPVVVVDQAVAVQQAEQSQPRVQESNFGCSVCHTSYGSSNHLKRHFGTAIHKANVKAQSEGPQEGAENSSKEHKPSEFKCEVCETSVSDASKLRRHFLTAAHQQKLRASTGTADEDEEVRRESEAAPRRQSQRQRHPPQRAYSPPRPTPRPYRCDLCTVEFESQRGLERHQTTKTHLAKAHAFMAPADDATVAYEFECENCAVTFPSAADLEHHYLTAHLSLSQEEIGGPALETIATSSPPKKLSCDVCGFRFKDSYHLRRHFMSQAHQRKVEAQRDIPDVVLEGVDEDSEDQEAETSGSSVIFHCETCDTTYKSARQIKRHYETPMHKQNFARARSAGEAQSTGSDDDTNNSDAQVYAPSTSKSVRTSITAMQGASDPRRHFKCEACNTFYLSGNHLRRHFATNSHLAMVASGGAAADIRIALPVKPKSTSPVKPQAAASSTSTSCAVCSSPFSSLVSLNMHMKKVHPELQPEEEVEDAKLEPSEEEDTGDEEQESEEGTTLNLDTMSPASGSRLVCEVCNASYRGNYDLQRHFRTLLHRTNVQNQTGGASQNVITIGSKQRSSQGVENRKKEARSVRDIVGIGHFLGALARPSSSRSSSNKKTRPKCEVCNKFYCSNKDLRKHYLTNTHQQMVAELEARRRESGTRATENSEEENGDGEEEEENKNESEEDMQSSDEGAGLGHVSPGHHASASSQAQPRAGPSPRKRARVSCETCRTSYQGQRDLQRHFLTQKHLQAVNKAPAKDIDGAGSAATTTSDSTHRPGPKSKTQGLGHGQYKCNTCETYYSSRADLEEHKQSSSHLTAVRIYLESENQLNSGEEDEGSEGRSMEEAAGGEIG